MPVTYRGKILDRNYSIKDFYNNGVVISWGTKWYRDNKPFMRCIFRSNGLLGEIRSVCYGNNYAIDVWTGWWSNERHCLTTECKSIKEAKSILFIWFKEHGFSVPKSVTDNDWSKKTLEFNDIQLTLNPFIFK